MAFGKSKIETADQIRSALTAAFAEFNNDADVVKARAAHEAAQQLAAAANVRVKECEAALHALAIRLTPEGQNLVARAAVLEAKIATVRRSIDEVKAGPGGNAKPSQLASLRESLGIQERNLSDMQHQLAMSKQRPSERELLAAPVDQRRAYRAAEAAIEPARQEAKATVEPLQDAKQDLATASAAAAARIKPRLLQLRALAIHRFNAALEVAKAENDLLAHVDGRINGTLGAGAMSPVTWREFDDPHPGYTPRLMGWREALRVTAPEAITSPSAVGC